jgi:hypothetical protein
MRLRRSSPRPPTNAHPPPCTFNIPASPMPSGIPRRTAYRPHEYHVGMSFLVCRNGSHQWVCWMGTLYAGDDGSGSGQQQPHIDVSCADADPCGQMIASFGTPREAIDTVRTAAMEPRPKAPGHAHAQQSPPRHRNSCRPQPRQGARL